MATTRERAITLTALNDRLVGIALPAMNRNMECKYTERLARWEKKVSEGDAVYVLRARTPRKARKGQAGLADGVQSFETQQVRVRRASSKVGGVRRTPNPPREHPCFTKDEFRVFLGILCYCGHHGITRFRSLWTRRDRLERGVISTIARNRAQLLYSCFSFDVETSLLFEKAVTDLIEEVWVPGSIVVVDESMIPFKGKKDNPYHVYIIRKPNPHGMKVSTIPCCVTWLLTMRAGVELGRLQRVLCFLLSISS